MGKVQIRNHDNFIMGSQLSERSFLNTQLVITIKVYTLLKVVHLENIKMQKEKCIFFKEIIAYQVHGKCDNN